MSDLIRRVRDACAVVLVSAALLFAALAVASLVGEACRP